MGVPVILGGVVTEKAHAADTFQVQAVYKGLDLHPGPPSSSGRDWGREGYRSEQGAGTPVFASPSPRSLHGRGDRKFYLNGCIEPLQGLGAMDPARYGLPEPIGYRSGDLHLPRPSVPWLLYMGVGLSGILIGGGVVLASRKRRGQHR